MFMTEADTFFGDNPLTPLPRPPMEIYEVKLAAKYESLAFIALFQGGQALAVILRFYLVF